LLNNSKTGTEKMKTTIYHNPRCGKSRETLAIIKSMGIEPEIIEYLKTPLKEDSIRKILKKLNAEPINIIRRKEAKDLGLDLKVMSSTELIKSMAKYPIIIERPIVIKGKKGLIGRPPEKVTEILEP